MLMRTILSEQNKLQAIGGNSFLLKLFSAVPTTANMIYYVKTIQECSTRRKLESIGKELMNWILPAWNALDEDERFVLDCFYSGNQYGTGAAEMVADHFCIEPSSAHRKTVL